MVVVVRPAPPRLAPMTGCSEGHDLYDPTCVACIYELPPPPKPPRPPETAVFSYLAKYAGQCPICDLPIGRGQRCATTDRDRVVHTACL